jgi:hypothetical protein
LPSWIQIHNTDARLYMGTVVITIMLLVWPGPNTGRISGMRRGGRTGSWSGNTAVETTAVIRYTPGGGPTTL